MTSIADTRLLLTFRFPPSAQTARAISRLVEYELNRRMLIPSVVVTEYLKIAGGRIGAESALVHLNSLESRSAEIIEIDQEIAVEAGRLLLNTPEVPLADSLIAAAMKVKRAAYVLSDDPHFKQLGVKTRWI